MEKIILLGAGGHAKTIVDTLERQRKYEIAGFVEKDCKGEAIYRGYSAIGTDDDLEKIYQSGIHTAVCSVGYLGNSSVRNRLYDKLKKLGFDLPIIVDDSAFLADDATVGEGTYIGRNAVINADAQIGRMCIINTSAVVEHDCVIGDFSHIAVGTVLCGGVQVGENCLIGANATVLQQRMIGDNTVIGAGTVVTKDCSEHIIVKSKLEQKVTRRGNI